MSAFRAGTVASEGGPGGVLGAGPVDLRGVELGLVDPGAGPWGPDWGELGLVLAIVGSFLIASGILFRDPRSLLEERFGPSALRLRTVRELVFHRVQMALGFAFLIGGFSLQLLDRARAAGDGASELASSGQAEGSTALWVGGLLVLVILLEIVGWWWSMLSIRRALRRWLVEHPGRLDADAHFAREVGELYGIASHGNDTVQSYVARLRRALDLPAPPPIRQRQEPEPVGEERD